MKPNSTSHHSILWKILLCYLLPVILLTLFDLTFVHKSTLNTLSLKIFLSILGTLCIYFLLSRYLQTFSISTSPLPIQAPPNEKVIYIEPDLKPLEEALKANEELNQQIQKLTLTYEEQTTEYQRLHEEMKELYQSFEVYRAESCEQLEQQQGLIRQLQHTIADQKSNIEKRQQQIGQLDSKVNDLNSELKTLMKLTETPEVIPQNNPPQPLPSRVRMEEGIRHSEKQITSVEDASLLLKRCLDISQKITGSYHFNSHIPASLDSAADNYTLDLRRLCDILRSEGKAVIVLYSPKDNQLLFVNNHIKIISGWTPEKFIQNFTDIVPDTTAWRTGVSGLSMRNEVQTKLTMKTRFGHDLVTHVHFGLIPTGIFRHHAIAIMWQPGSSPSSFEI